MEKNSEIGHSSKQSQFVVYDLLFVLFYRFLLVDSPESS
jgi:hypothetical protein